MSDHDVEKSMKQHADFTQKTEKEGKDKMTAAQEMSPVVED
jgi:hypothetical protein